MRFGGEEFCIQSYSPFDHFIAKLENMREDVSKTPTVHFENDYYDDIYRSNRYSGFWMRKSKRRTTGSIPPRDLGVTS